MHKADTVGTSTMPDKPLIVRVLLEPQVVISESVTRLAQVAPNLLGFVEIRAARWPVKQQAALHASLLLVPKIVDVPQKWLAASFLVSHHCLADEEYHMPAELIAAMTILHGEAKCSLARAQEIEEIVTFIHFIARSAVTPK